MIGCFTGVKVINTSEKETHSSTDNAEILIFCNEFLFISKKF